VNGGEGRGEERGDKAKSDVQGEERGAKLRRPLRAAPFALRFALRVVPALFASLVSLTAQSAANAQNPPNAAERLREQRDSLSRIRAERNTLQRQMRELQATAHDLSAERANLERLADATARVVRALDQQLGALADEEREITVTLVRTQDELAIKRSALRHRVREIYKRGPLYSFEALLSAQTFGELVARYKYLHLVTQRDRFLVNRVEALGAQIGSQRSTLVKLRDDMEASRQEKADEEKRLRVLEEQRGRSLVQTQEKQRQAEARLAQITRDEARLASVIAEFDAERRRVEGVRGGSVGSTSTLRTSDSVGWTGRWRGTSSTRSGGW